MQEEKNTKITLTVPVVVSITMDYERAKDLGLSESLLAKMCDGILKRASEKIGVVEDAHYSIPFDWSICSAWDKIPEQEIELCDYDEGIFDMLEDDAD
jgi:hypothetical protein